MKVITQKSLNIPKPRKLPKSGDACWDEDSYEAVPFAIVGDDTFQLSNHMLKPYKGRSLTDEQIIFNYRLSTFRRCVENAFGILVARFRVFLSRINIRSTAKVNKVILAGVVLHNMSRHSYGEVKCQKALPIIPLFYLAVAGHVKQKNTAMRFVTLFWFKYK